MRPNDRLDNFWPRPGTATLVDEFYAICGASFMHCMYFFVYECYSLSGTSSYKCRAGKFFSMEPNRIFESYLKVLCVETSTSLASL